MVTPLMNLFLYLLLRMTWLRDLRFRRTAAQTVHNLDISCTSW